MKKIETVKIPAKKAVAAKPATTKQVEKTVCDFCGASVPDHGSYGWYPRCACCGRDTCRKHNTFDPDEPGDYGDWFCQICLPLLLPARREMQERHWNEEEELVKKIKEISLASE
jgi:hypothetical protein